MVIKRVLCSYFGSMQSEIIVTFSEILGLMELKFKI